MIVPIWQPLFSSSHKLANECGMILGQKATHTGTLDPMAEGVLIVLSDEDRYVKGSLSDWQKVYEFSILWGVETDSGDRLGVIKKFNDLTPDLSQLETVLKNFPTQYEQIVPAFSANRWQGKSSFDWARAEVAQPQKKRLVNLEKLSIKNYFHLSLTDIVEQHAQAVSQVSGDFRQKTILKNWAELLQKKSRELPQEYKFLVTQHQVTTSAGTYIRQLVQDLSQQLGCPAITWAITRIANGPFEKVDCIAVDELDVSLVK